MTDNAQLEQSDLLAAVDLGSNSFHMIIARFRDGHFQVVDRLREMVQLRAGLDEDMILSDEAQERALTCLQRFGERVRTLPNGSVRVVGTNTLRVAQNSRRFLKQAREAIGHPIEIVTGEEEARLIYQGVAHSLAFDSKRRFVMDIGGGSTEFIIGEGMSGLKRESLEMGCVSYSQKFFPKGETLPSQLMQAQLEAAGNIRSIQRPYINMGWVDAVGASGTIRCVANICKEEGWSIEGVITREALHKLIDRLGQAGSVKSAKLAGLSDERQSVIAGGACILAAAFERLEIDKMTVSDGAMREGLLYDLLGRIQHDDERERTVMAFSRRYQIDEVHADRVSMMATHLYEQVAKKWDILDEDYEQRLQWACKMHEVGLAIAHSQFQKHSAYLLEHSDLPGFSREEQLVLSVIVRGQRKSFPTKYIAQLPDELQDSTEKLTILLRLSMVFNRGRSERTDTVLKFKVDDSTLTLTLPENWLEQHPLTKADLAQEAKYLKKAGFVLDYQD